MYGPQLSTGSFYQVNLKTRISFSLKNVNQNKQGSVPKFLLLGQSLVLCGERSEPSGIA
jgi:hypothetical protein